MPYRRRTHRRRSSVRSRRTRRRTRIYKQKAGGDWQSFCAACGKPLSNWALDRAPFNLPDEETAWMNRNVGYDAEHALILELGADNMLGTSPILNEQHEEMREILTYMATEDGGNFDISEFHIQGAGVVYDPERQLGGIVIHKACEEQLERLDLKVGSFDLIQKLNAGCVANKQYQDQDYDWEEALATNPNHHKSPSRSKSARRELLLGCAHDVPEVMAAVREEKARRKRVINKKRFANVTQKMNKSSAFNASHPIAKVVERLPRAVINQIGSYLAAPENIKAGNRVAPGNIVNVSAGASAAVAPLGGAGNGRAPPSGGAGNVD